jgi:serine/threonine protein kinase
MQNDPDKTIASDAPVENAGELQCGTIIDGKYQILSSIGRGGMGAVYRAQQKYLGKDFALKILDLHQRSEATVRRFLQEARTAAQLQHPNLVEVHDFGEFGDEQPYLVMDLIEGVTLAEVLKNKGSLPIDYVVTLCIQVCFGLMYAHEKGVVHRDIKPGNIMLVHPEREPAEGTIKIVDFGIAKLMQSEAGEMHALTQTGELFGSPIYMSPEQCKGTAVDKRSDIYSLGCVVYECLTSTPPFLGDTAMSTMLRRLSEKPLSLKEASLGHEFPQALEAIVSKMLATDPDDRYQELGSLVKDLMALQRPEDGVIISSVAKPAVVKESTPNISNAMIMIAIGVAACVSTAVFDRAVVYPHFFAPKNASKAAAPKAIVNAPVNLASNLALGSASSSEVSRGFTDPDFLHLNPADPLKGTGYMVKGERLTKGREKLPELIVGVDKNGKTQQFLYFPDNYGAITVGDEKKKKACGAIPVDPGVPVSLKFNDGIAESGGLLKEITSLNIRRIDFPGRYAVRDSNLASIDQMVDTLEELSIEESRVTSLASLYKARKLLALEAGRTELPTEEFLRIERLPSLKVLSFGPVPNPKVIFDRLAESSNVVKLDYEGGLKGAGAVGHGLSSTETSALSRIRSVEYLTIQHCPDFDDKRLEQLLPMQNIATLKITECALTSKCIPTLRKFKNLKTICLDKKGFSTKDMDMLTRFYSCEFEGPINDKPLN